MIKMDKEKIKKFCIFWSVALTTASLVVLSGWFIFYLLGYPNQDAISISLLLFSIAFILIMIYIILDSFNTKNNNMVK